MNLVLRTVIIDADPTTRAELKSTLSGIETVWLESEFTDCREAVPQLAASPPDIALFGIDARREDALCAIADLARQARHCAICAVSRSSDGQVILAAMRAGAREFLSLPADAAALGAVLRSLASLPGLEGKPQRGGMTIAVTGSAGGVGATSLAVNLACALAAADPARSVTLVDLDLALGDADVFLDTAAEFTLADVAQNIDRLDFDLLRRSLTRHKSGVSLLPRPLDVHDAASIDEEAVRRMLAMLKASTTHVVLDLSKGFTRLDFAALEACDVALLVTQLDLQGLRNVVRLMKAFHAAGELESKVRLVLNRSVAVGDSIRLKKAEEIVGRRFFWQIPNDFRLITEVRNNGVPLIELAPRAALTQSVVELAAAVCGDAGSAGRAGSARGGTIPFFGRWFAAQPPIAAGNS